MCSNQLRRDFTFDTTSTRAWQCMLKAAEEQGISRNATFVQPASDVGYQGYRTKCKTGERDEYRCKVLNSGGGMAVPAIGYWQSCVLERTGTNPPFADFMKCFKFTKVNDSYTLVNLAGDCAACSTPYYCMPDDPNDLINPNLYKLRAGISAGRERKDEEATNHEDEEFRAYLGMQGDGQKQLFFSWVTMPTLEMSSTNLMCKWKKWHWNEWVAEMRELYKYILHQAVKVSDESLMFPTGLTPGYMWALPASGLYLENEVDLYTYPDVEDAEYRMQDRTLQRAIMAVFIDDRTCEEQLSSLDGVSTTMLNGTVLADAKSRCEVYGVDPVLEKESIASDTKFAQDLHAMLPGTVLLRAKPASVAFPDKTTWDPALQGRGQVDPKTLFFPF